jgi:hypothetical protein
MVAMTVSVAGLRDLKVRPDADGTRRPSIKSSLSLVIGMTGDLSRE